MRFTVNGRPREHDGPVTIAEYLASIGVNPLAVAVEHNGAIVRRDEFASMTIEEGARLEIVRMMGGGCSMAGAENA